MACRFILFDPTTPRDEWVPMALRDTTCLRRVADPTRWNARLREQGIDVDDEECHCVQNLNSAWETCPFYEARPPEAP